MFRVSGVFKMKSEEQSSTVSRLLRELHEDKPETYNKLFEIVYEELKKLAKQQRHNWDGDYTINTTALVHERYIKLVNKPLPAGNMIMNDAPFPTLLST